jgi:CRP/FNR family transcriptional regulator
MTPCPPKTSCLTCRLSDLCLPFGLQIEEVETLEIIIKNKRPLRLGELLFSKNEPCHGLFAVKSGSFRRFVMNAEGVDQTLGFYLPGELIGLDALFDGRYTCSVDALETSSVCELPLTRLNELCAKIPNLQYQLTRILSKEITTNHEQMFLLSNNSAKIKVASFLLMLSKRYGALGYSHTHFNLSMPRQTIASFLGLSNETVSRQLTSLCKEKIILVNQRAIQINDFGLLQAIIEPCHSH